MTERTQPERTQPDPEEVLLYEKDPSTKIATITLNRPEHLNAPTIGMRLRYAHLLDLANVDDDVKVLVVRGAGDDFGSGADLPELAALMAAVAGGSAARGAPARRGGRELPAEQDVPRVGRHPRLLVRRFRDRGAAPCRTSRRSASSRPRATATAGTSTRRPTQISSSPRRTPSSAIPPSATSAGDRECGRGP